MRAPPAPPAQPKPAPPCPRRPAKLAKVIDLKAARQEPDRYRTALARRGAAKDFDALLAVDAKWREHTERAETLRAAQKRSSKGKPGPDELAELGQAGGGVGAGGEGEG